MNIIINGAGGRMGRALRAMIEKKGAQAAALIDPFVKEEGMLSALADYQGAADCIIDFSNHSGTQALLDYAVE